MDLASLLELAKDPNIRPLIAMAVGAYLMHAAIKQVAPIMKQIRLWGGGSRSQKEITTSPKNAPQTRSRVSAKMPSTVILPVSSVVLSALVILSATGPQPVAGARLLLVLALTALAAVSLSLWLVLPLLLLLADAVRVLREGRRDD